MEWTIDRLRALETKDLKQLFENAAQRGRSDLVALCEEVLEERITSGRAHLYVAEFHFVCRDSKGVHELPDGTFTTGTWVVSEVHKAPSLRRRSIVALHQSQSEPSYRQGHVVGWGREERGVFGDGTGVRFTIEPIGGTLPWGGDGTVERSYVWAEVPRI